MSRIGQGAAIISVALLICSCAPVLVGGLIWKSQKSKSEKQQFLKNLNELNLEREKAGLQPLDKCIEMYHFDPGWAMESADCKDIIDSLQAAGIKPDSTKIFEEENKGEKEAEEEDRW